MRFLVGADVPPDPDSGAAGTVYHTNAALRALGHEVDEIWAADLGRRIAHGNLHYLLELPRAYRREVAQRCRQRTYDAIMLSQPHAWLVARDHLQQRRPGLFINRSHGFEPMAESSIDFWRQKLGLPDPRFPRRLATAILRRMLGRHVALASRYSQSFVVPSEDIRRYLVDVCGVPAKRVAMVHHGVQASFAECSALPMTTERLSRLLYVGQFAFIKGPPVLAEAVGRLMSVHSHLSMTWVCSRRHHAEAAALLPAGVRAKVTFQDWLPQEELIRVYDQHGIFVFPSFYEGAGKACLEAMSRGLCVVASDVGALSDYIRDQENGRLVPVGDVQALCGAMEWFLSNPDQAGECARLAHAEARRCTWRACAEGIVDFARHRMEAVR